MIDRDSLIERTGDLASASMGHELAMMDLESGAYYVLAPVAAFIWSHLAAPTTPAALCDTLLQEYDVSRERCEADVLPFLRKLHAKGLVRIVA